MSSEIHLSGVSTSSRPESPSLNSRQKASTSKVVPKRFKKRRDVVFTYEPSLDGIDTNLLILLHGRGDSEAPFSKLGKNLALPQTATLAIRGPEVVPLLDEHEREWWNETDMLGMDVQNQNPSPAIALLSDVIQELTEPPYLWTANDIHLFGFGQGGSLALETAISFYRQNCKIATADEEASMSSEVGSVVSIQGPLLSLPAKGSTKAPTPVLFFTRQSSSASTFLIDKEMAALNRGFTKVETVNLLGRSGEIRMPGNKDEWQGIMKFWSTVLQRRNAWQLSTGAPGEEIIEITGGASQVTIPQSANTSSTSKPSQVAVPSAAVSVGAPARPKQGGISGFSKGFLSKGL